MTTRTGSLLVIAGPPAAGKTTIAEHIATDADVPTVHMPTDLLHTWIKSGFQLPFLPEGAHQNAVVEEVMIAAATKYAEGGYDVILDGVLGPWAVDDLCKTVAVAGLSLSYVIVRPSLPALLHRAEAREGRHLRDIEPIVGLHRAFEAVDDDRLAVLDTTDESVQASVKRLVAAWHEGKLELLARTDSP